MSPSQAQSRFGGAARRVSQRQPVVRKPLRPDAGRRPAGDGVLVALPKQVRLAVPVDERAGIDGPAQPGAALHLADQRFRGGVEVGTLGTRGHCPRDALEPRGPVARGVVEDVASPARQHGGRPRQARFAHRPGGQLGYGIADQRPGREIRRRGELQIPAVRPGGKSVVAVAGAQHEGIGEISVHPAGGRIHGLGIGALSGWPRGQHDREDHHHQGGSAQQPEAHANPYCFCTAGFVARLPGRASAGGPKI